METEKSDAFVPRSVPSISQTVQIHLRRVGFLALLCLGLFLLFLLLLVSVFLGQSLTMQFKLAMKS